MVDSLNVLSRNKIIIAHSIYLHAVSRKFMALCILWQDIAPQFNRCAGSVWTSTLSILEIWCYIGFQPKYLRSTGWLFIPSEHRSYYLGNSTQITEFMEPIWGPPGSWVHVGPMKLAISVPSQRNLRNRNVGRVLQMLCKIVEVWYDPIGL